MRVMRIGLLAATVAAALASWQPASAAQNTAQPADLVALENLHASSVADATQADSPFSNLRVRAQSAAATSIGAQAGLIWRSKQINHILEAESRTLDKAFDFRSVMLDHGLVVPPVIEEARSTWVGSRTQASSSQVEYHLIAPAYIAPAAPNWRTWLMLAVGTPMQADPAILPRTPAEQQAWAQAVQSGWKDGVAQANAIFATDVHRLTRDLGGMLLFQNLESRGMVAAPILANGDVAVRVQGKALVIGQREFQLTLPARFRSDASWKAVTASPKLLPDLQRNINPAKPYPGQQPVVRFVN